MICLIYIQIGILDDLCWFPSICVYNSTYVPACELKGVGLGNPKFFRYFNLKKKLLKRGDALRYHPGIKNLSGIHQNIENIHLLILARFFYCPYYCHEQ